MSRLLIPQLSFADLQLQNLGIHLDPCLQRISDFLKQHADLVELVRKDLERGLKKPGAGRHGITPEQTLRSLILMRVKNLDYRDLRDRINDGFTLRSFTQFDSHSVPQHDAFNRAFNRLTPATLAAINHLVVQAAVELDLEDGKQLRVDTTVVETNIHHPTDATLLWDTVRTITRLVDDLDEKLPRGVKGFTNRTRSARRRMQALQRMTARQREQQQTPKYRELIRITEQVLKNAKHVIAAAKRIRRVDVVTRAAIDAICKQITSFCQLGERVIDQTRRRVLQGETVPTEEKLYSIFEPHTDLIKRGKTLKPVEFGHKVFLAESAQGLITDYRVLKGNPVDSDHVQASLDQHQKTFQTGTGRVRWRPGFLQRRECPELQERRRELGVHTPEGWPENGGAGRVGAQPCLQEGPAIPGGHRGAHLGAISRPRHETLFVQRPRAVRDSGGRGGAGQ